MPGERICIQDILAAKARRKITMLTAYDYPLAELVDKSGIDMIMVGDSLANVVLGLESTREVGMAEMLYHAKAVTRAVKHALVIADMPYGAYQPHPEEGLKNARRFIEEAKCQAVKLEWFAQCAGLAKEIAKNGIAVMGHIGLTPQTADSLGGFKVQGNDSLAAQKLIQQAQELEAAGCFSVVLECIPQEIAGIITAQLKIPTIGIGAGVHCDGQVLVIHDIIGLFPRFNPKFVKRYADVSALILKAIEEFRQDVLNGRFPDSGHSFNIKPEELKKINP